MRSSFLSTLTFSAPPDSSGRPRGRRFPQRKYVAFLVNSQTSISPCCKNCAAFFVCLKTLPSGSNRSFIARNIASNSTSSMQLGPMCGRLPVGLHQPATLDVPQVGIAEGFEISIFMGLHNLSWRWQRHTTVYGRFELQQCGIRGHRARRRGVPLIIWARPPLHKQAPRLPSHACALNTKTARPILVRLHRCNGEPKLEVLRFLSSRMARGHAMGYDS